ncbi:hypothetical protein MYU51_007195 [Penicillium brevicompactum]|uniref:Uncharacterized protein n=1 Tax=Penicillium brevicompactum TaxID=5074 RepID=A0A9W9QEC8_PENBR|nr:uncharacterized protein N7506_002135 [Penicillium brevicompactum]KAJ5329587.1 hypothetical protein N7452_009977 [Penicillium brevicompactum]KAJ5348882.1 hypothetical protein N7506_002135 [Penicillium brevicompactum]
MTPNTLITLFRRDGNGDESVSGPKPTSRALTVGVPAAITGFLLLTAIIVLVILYFKRQRRDDREDLEERQRDSGFYGNYATQRFGTAGAQQGPRKAYATESRRSSGESFFDYKQDHGPYHLAQFQGPEVPKPAATRVVS